MPNIVEDQGSPTSSGVYCKSTMKTSVYYGACVGARSNKGQEPNTRVNIEENMLPCFMHDIWGFITSMQTTMMKQGEELKTLALKNQECEHRIKVQDMQVSNQKNKL